MSSTSTLPYQLFPLNPSIIFLSTPFSIILTRRWSLKVSDQVSQPYETTGKIIVLYEGWNFNSGNYLFTTDTK